MQFIRKILYSFILPSFFVSPVFAAPIDSTLKCYNFITKERKIKSFDGYYLENNRSKNILQDLSARLNKIASLQNTAASTSTRDGAKAIQKNLENYYQCDSAGNPMPNRIDSRGPQSASMKESLEKYDMLCLPTERGIKKVKISDMREFLKELEALNKNRANYEKSFEQAISNLESKTTMSRYDRLSNSQLNSVILSRAIPKTNLKTDSKDFTANYEAACSQTLRSSINDGAAIRSIRNNPYSEGQQRSRPGSATR